MSCNFVRSETFQTTLVLVRTRVEKISRFCLRQSQERCRTVWDFSCDPIRQTTPRWATSNESKQADDNSRINNPVRTISIGEDNPTQSVFSMTRIFSTIACVGTIVGVCDETGRLFVHFRGSTARFRSPAPLDWASGVSRICIRRAAMFARIGTYEHVFVAEFRASSGGYVTVFTIKRDTCFCSSRSYLYENDGTFRAVL